MPRAKRLTKSKIKNKKSKKDSYSSKALTNSKIKNRKKIPIVRKSLQSMPRVMARPFSIILFLLLTFDFLLFTLLYPYFILTNSLGNLPHSSLGSDLKYSYVTFKPSLRLTFGSQPSNVLAFVMSGCLCFGSSTGNGL